MNFVTNSLLLCIFSVAFCHEHLDTDPHLLPEKLEPRCDISIEEVRLRCNGWRVATEANNLSPWKTIPAECVDYVKDYMLSRSYEIDLELVSDEAIRFAKSFDFKGDGMDAWIFDIDETLLSNLPYHAEHGYGLEVFDDLQFNKWVLEGLAPTVEPSLKLYNEVLKLGFRIFLLTGRRENKRNITVNNLINAGFQNWERLILRVKGRKEKRRRRKHSKLHK